MRAFIHIRDHEAFISSRILANYHSARRRALRRKLLSGLLMAAAAATLIPIGTEAGLWILLALVH